MSRMFGKKPIEQLPFELLVVEHLSRPQEVYNEFVRRLNVIVFQAAQAHLRQHKPGSTRSEVERVVVDIFTQFAPEIASGSPGTILVRFAATIRRKLGDTAFRQVAKRFYAQIPIYHVRSDQHRIFLTAAYEGGLQLDLVTRLSARFGVTETQCRTILTKANAAFAKVIAGKSLLKDLRQSTDGYFP